MRNTLIFIFTFFGVKASGQSTDTVIGAVYYSYSQVMDTTNSSELYIENMVLYLGKKSSLFKSRNREIQDSILSNSREIPTRITVKNSGSTSEYFKFYEKNRLVTVRRLFNSYIIEDSLPSIKWTIKNDTKQVYGFPCQKALGRFKGRTYEAWFTTAIASSDGPWKLRGLPGLILEASDTKKQVIFNLSGYNPHLTELKLIQLPRNAIKTTDAAFNKIIEAAEQDPAGFLQSNSNGKITITSMPKLPPRKKPNNPIELPEK